MMRRILFVDDEPNVLQGLKRLLRPMRREWEMTFCPSGPEALEKLAEARFDVIVSDMQMPGMDGAELLTRVMQQHPQVVRIVLSGHSSMEATVKSVGVAHQFLAKPCEAETLKHTIDHAFALRGLLSNEKLKQLVSRLESVPSLPTLYQEVIEELQHPDASSKRVGEIVAQDPGMTVKILQLVNSAFFGVARQISSAVEAAQLLGTETIKALVLSIGVFTEFKGVAVTGIDLESARKHATETGTVAKRIAAVEKAAANVAEACLMAGFLHDLGKLILAVNLPEQYETIMTRTKETGDSLCDVERQVLGATHAEVAAYLLGLWGIPDPIVEAAAFHHCPGQSGGRCFSPLTAVHAANVFVSERDDAAVGGLVQKLDVDYLKQLELADRIDLWREVGRAVLDGGDEA
ncbi:MAG: response regulator [Phycisphaerae bacterium]